eukprot:356545-Chlamydomonas_euryale.AAC.4
MQRSDCMLHGCKVQLIGARQCAKCVKWRRSTCRISGLAGRRTTPARTIHGRLAGGTLADGSASAAWPATTADEHSDRQPL